MHKPRRAYETGHRPKFLALVEEGPEADRALRFAARRARRVGASLLLLAVVEPDEEAPPLLGVADLNPAALVTAGKPAPPRPKPASRRAPRPRRSLR